MKILAADPAPSEAKRNPRLWPEAARFAIAAAFAFLSLCDPLAAPAAPVITYVQGNYAVPQSPETTVAVPFDQAQTAGDLNVVVVGWNDGTATVSSVTDSRGNRYQLAVGPTVIEGVLSQSIYYANNIQAAGAGANTVTVRFSAAAVYPDIRILEYRGADLSSPVDGTAAQSGSGTMSSSGPVKTANATSLLFAANTVTSHVNGPGSAFVSRLLTYPDGDIAQDRMLTAAGSYNADAPMTDGSWVMQAVAFRTPATATDQQAPTSPTNLAATPVSGSQVNLRWTASTDNVGVTGYLIERCQGAGCTNFSRLLTVTGTAYTDTALVAQTSYTYQVRATDAAGNFSPYSNTATTLTLANASGLVAAYSFDEAAGTTVKDLSGNGNTGTLKDTAWTSSGKYGSALTFDGVGSQVSINDAPSLHLTTAMTLEAWVKPSIVDNAWRDVIYKGGNDNYFLEATSTQDGVAAGGATIGGVDSVILGTSSLRLNTWTHLALTYDGAAQRFYVNGALVSTQPITGSILTSDTPLQIGGDAVYGQFFAGVIDEVRVYNVALNQGQIQADMATPLGGGNSMPEVKLSASSLNFAGVETGTTSVAQAVTLSNVGTAPLSITGIGIAGANAGDFAQSNNCGTTLAPGALCTINVTFTPTTTGARISSLAINDNVTGSPQTIALSGSGTGFAVSPRVTVLTATQTQQFTASGSVTWSVDGIVGGNATVGFISPTGLYTPSLAAGTHTVRATAQQTASATVYITNYPGTFTFHNDNLRSGVNPSETVLTPANVNAAQFGKLFSYPIDGWAFASPLYVANLNIPGKGLHNVVFVATEHDSVYAFDADGRTSEPLWKVSFLRTDVTTVPCEEVGECNDIPVEIGISGTPVIDRATGTLYVVAKTREANTTYVQRLHALDLATGAEKFGGPVVIEASVNGSGAGAVDSKLAFDPLRENQRGGLLLSNGVIYIPFAAHGDVPPWHGWVLGYNATTLQKTVTWCVSPNGYGGGIWQSGAGLAADALGNVFFATGNGNFNADTGGKDFGDSIVKLAPNGALADYFTPFDQAMMEEFNMEPSSAGPVLLVDQPGPIPHRLVTAGKTGTIYVIDRENMGHFQSGSDSQIIQSLPGALPNGGPEEGNYSAPVFFNNTIYYGAVKDHLRAFRFTNGTLASAPVSQSDAVYSNRGAFFAVSANRSSNGLLWAVQDNTPAEGVLRVYDANDLANEVYNSDQPNSRDTLGLATKFSVPLVANGKVFVVGKNAVTVYGLLP
jgi:chitodextrinase